VQGATLVQILVGFAVVAIALALAARWGRRVGGDVDLVRRDPSPPWWGRPGVWILASAGFVLLGLFVFPRLFGFTFVFLPLLWVGGLRRGRSSADERRGPPDPPGGPDAPGAP
jgi:hypothetical protein